MKVWTVFLLTMALSFGLLGCNRGPGPAEEAPQPTTIVTVPTVRPNIPDPTVDHNSTNPIGQTHSPATENMPSHRQDNQKIR